MKKTSLKIALSLFWSTYFLIFTCEANSKVRYFVPKIEGIPVAKGVSLEVPKVLENSKLSFMGLVDVTAKPFSADPSGKEDSTKALQQAINFARDHQMATFFPQGNYLISNTLECWQDYRDLKPLNKYQNDKRVFFARKFPCVLMGSRIGSRPKIILSPNSPGYQDPSNPKYVIHFYATLNKGQNESPLQPNMSMNQMFINIDIVIGKGNSGAVAIRHRGAEGSSIEDCTIDATYGLTGVEGGCGSGGSDADIKIIGGKIGMDLRETQPAPTITGITLINQTKTAILYGGRQSLCAVGIKIISQVKGPIVECSGWTGPNHGQMALVDCQIDCKNPNAVAISSNHSIYLKNVYVHGGKTAVQIKESNEINANRNSWLHIKEYAKGVSPHKWHGYHFQAPIYINGIRTEETIKDVALNDLPPKDLQSRHLWDRVNFPNFESERVANVKTQPYNAKGDGKHDDTEAIQKAINHNEIVFLPKGYYSITRTLALKPHTKLIGIAKHLSVLLVTNNTGDFRSPTLHKPVVQSFSDKNSDSLLAFFEIFVPIKPTGAFALDWRSGRNSIVRDVSFRYGSLKGFRPKRNIFELNHPLVIVTGNGGGKWYNFDSGNKEFQGPDYRHLLIQGTDEPLSIYQCAPQHAHSEANMEIRDSRNVCIFGMKGETDIALMLKIKDSNNISLYGYGGNASARKNKSLFYIENCNNITLVNLVDTPVFILNKHLTNEWHMVEEKNGGNIYKTRYFDRPVLYRVFRPLFKP